MLALAAAVALAGRHARLLRVSLVAMIGSIFLYVQVGRLMRDITAGAAVEAEKGRLVAAVTTLAAPGDIVLIDPVVEGQWLDFERRTAHPTLVMWKFAPTNDAELITWYRRIERRRAVFDQGCVADIGVVRLAFLLTTPAGVSRLATTRAPRCSARGNGYCCGTPSEGHLHTAPPAGEPTPSSGVPLLLDSHLNYPNSLMYRRVRPAYRRRHTVRSRGRHHRRPRCACA